jgi:hypothetical protein
LVVRDPRTHLSILARPRILSPHSQYEGIQDGKSKPGSKKRLAEQGFSKINKLYEIERGYKNASPAERYALSKKVLASRLADLREWTLESKDRVPPQSLTGTAID